MATGGISTIENGVKQNLEGMVQRGKSVSAYLSRVVWPKYQKAQNERWQTENSSQGDHWVPLNVQYARYKKKKFASYEGGGNKMMIATGKLSKGARGVDAGYFYKIISDSSFVIGMNLSSVPYAGYAGDARPYMEFSDDTLSDWKAGIRDYICKKQGAL